MGELRSPRKVLSVLRGEYPLREVLIRKLMVEDTWQHFLQA